MTSKRMGSSEIATRYAAAFLELADEEKALTKAESDLQTLRKMFEESNELQMVVRNPLLTRDDLVRAMGALCDKAGLCEIVAKFVGTVAQNRRAHALPEIIDAIQAELSRRKGEVEAEVISAEKLTAAQEKSISTMLKKSLGSDVIISTVVDKDIMGGLIVRVGSQMIDNSLKTKMQRLKRAMKEQHGMEIAVNDEGNKTIKGVG